jgi:hypothetical protein
LWSDETKLLILGNASIGRIHQHELLRLMGKEKQHVLSYTWDVG